MIAVRAACATDADAWLAQRLALWPDDSAAEHRAEIERYFRGEFPRWEWVVLLAEDDDGAIVGFAEVSERNYAQGCSSARVAYLEGWYVAPESRRRGVGRALIGAAEAWGRARGCTEFASDAHAENLLSFHAHTGLGFEDVGLMRCFRKEL